MLSALPFLTCKFTETKPVTAPAGFDWQGHRGCRGLLPENSIPAFLRALEFPEVVTLELDLAVSKDRQLIVSHEPWFNPGICRQPNGDSIAGRDAEKFLLYERTADEIRGFDCGSQGNPRFAQQQKMKTYKPTLREVVAAVRTQYPDRPVRWNMEIKSQPEWDGRRTPPIEEFARLVATALHDMGLENQTVVQSFDPRALEAMHRINPALRLAFLIENANGPISNLARLSFQPAIYSPYYLMVDKKLVRQCHERGIQLIPWTVNDVPAMRRLIRLGVDGIITDYPDKIAAAIK
ncbi:MAG: glycerophosphodiester phosphodiesterase [Saprospiraceae bacterium]|nr:glycerophosphodiester phosphodiesterase [Saprospiraceae bacterium]